LAASLMLLARILGSLASWAQTSKSERSSPRGIERPGGRRVPRTGSTSEALSRSSAVMRPRRQQLFRKSPADRLGVLVVQEPPREIQSADLAGGGEAGYGLKRCAHGPPRAGREP